MKKLLFKIQKKGELNTAYSDFAAKQIRTIFPQAQATAIATLLYISIYIVYILYMLN